MGYVHRDACEKAIELDVGKVVCVGRNYVDHVKELNNEMPQQPLLFMKPATSLCHIQETLLLPHNLGECHNELELAILIQSPLKNANLVDAKKAIWGVGLALDLTLRDLQNELKSKGLPWERAKAFDRACPVSGFVPVREISDLQSLTFQLMINQQVRQQGDASLMIWDICSLLSQISEVFTLLPGDVVLTGTPKGVGPLSKGDVLQMHLGDHLHLHTQVQEAS